MGIVSCELGSENEKSKNEIQNSKT